MHALPSVQPFRVCYARVTDDWFGRLTRSHPLADTEHCPSLLLALAAVWIVLILPDPVGLRPSVLVSPEYWIIVVSEKCNVVRNERHRKPVGTEIAMHGGTANATLPVTPVARLRAILSEAAQLSATRQSMQQVRIACMPGETC